MIKAYPTCQCVPIFIHIRFLFPSSIIKHTRSHTHPYTFTQQMNIQWYSSFFFLVTTSLQFTVCSLFFFAVSQTSTRRRWIEMYSFFSLLSVQFIIPLWTSNSSYKQICTYIRCVKKKQNEYIFMKWTKKNCATFTAIRLSPSSILDWRETETVLHKIMWIFSTINYFLISPYFLLSLSADLDCLQLGNFIAWSRAAAVIIC